MITMHRISRPRDLCTLGFMVIGNEVFWTLEPPWRNNERNISCIPDGVYEVEFMARSASGKYRNCFHVKNVDGRTGILIHNGNVPDHTKGCLLIGKKAGTLAGKPAVLNSKTALSEFGDMVNSCFQLRIDTWI